MECGLQLKSVERVEGERFAVTFEVRHEAVEPFELQVKVETMSGHHAAEQGRQKLRDFALALAEAAEKLQPHV